MKFITKRELGIYRTPVYQYNQINYRDKKTGQFRTKKAWKISKAWRKRKKIIPPPPEPPKVPLEPNEYEFDFKDISETDYETKMIADVGLHDFLEDYIDKKCYDENENAYRFDIHVTQVFAGVTHAESLLDWQLDAESYVPKNIATIILIKLAKMKNIVPFVSQKAILSIEAVND